MKKKGIAWLLCLVLLLVVVYPLGYSLTKGNLRTKMLNLIYGYFPTRPADLSNGKVKLENLITPSIQGTRNEKWVADLQFVKEKLPLYHVDPFFQLPEKKFIAEMNSLIESVPQATDSELTAGLAKVLASMGDYHTMLWPNGGTVFPVEFYLFEDGLYVIDTIEEYNMALGQRITQINGYTLAEIEEKFAPFIVAGNEPLKKFSICYFLKSPLMVKISGLSTEENMVLQFEDGSTLIIQPVVLKDLRNLKFLSDDPDYFDRIPITRRQSASPYWYTYLDGLNGMYVKLNHWDSAKDYPIEKFFQDMFRDLDQRKGEKLIIDFRDNPGGELLLAESLFRGLKERPSLEGHVFVIIGRGSSSAAAIAPYLLKKEFNVVLLGEETSGTIASYGNPQKLRLSNVNLIVQFSTAAINYANEKTLRPDVEIPLTAKNYYQGIDDILQYIESID